MAAAAASSLKPKLLAGAWGTVGSVGAYALYRQIRDFEEKTPCMLDAVRLAASSSAVQSSLGVGELSIARWPRSSRVDERHGLSRASFEVRGPSGHVHLIMGARRQARAQQAAEEKLEDEEDEEELQGWRRYFYRPWELKAKVVRMLSQPKVESGGEGAEEEPPWDLETVFVLPGGDGKHPIVLMGDPTSLPEYEALYVRRDARAKADYSRNQLRVVGGLAIAAALVAGGARVVKSINVSRSYGYVKRSLLKHSEVVAALGGRPQIQTSSGTFGARYINAQLRLVGEGGAVADVDIAATRDATAASAPWRVLMARMIVGGLAKKLDKSKF